MRDTKTLWTIVDDKKNISVGENTGWFEIYTTRQLGKRLANYATDPVVARVSARNKHEFDHGWNSSYSNTVFVAQILRTSEMPPLRYYKLTVCRLGTDRWAKHKCRPNSRTLRSFWQTLVQNEPRTWPFADRLLLCQTLCPDLTNRARLEELIRTHPGIVRIVDEPDAAMRQLVYEHDEYHQAFCYLRNPTDDIYLEAVRARPGYMGYVPNEKRTLQMYQVYVDHCRCNVDEVPEKWRDQIVVPPPNKK